MKKDALPRWGGLREAQNLPAPSDNRPYIDYPHATVNGFYVRVLRARGDGKVARKWVHRYAVMEDDGAGGLKKRDVKKPIGQANALEAGDEVMELDKALFLVTSKRQAQKEAKRDGTEAVDRLTVAQAWSLYPAEKRLNRETTKDKDAGHYTRYLEHLKDRYLDELTYASWSRYVSQLGEGTLSLGKRADKDGRLVDVLAPKLANSTMLGVLNVAVALYEIAHKHKGLRGMAETENPARKAKELIGEPNKRRGRIPLNRLALAWNASDQMCAAGWRDMFRVYVLTGLRNALVTTMTFSEINFETGHYVVSPHKPGTKRRGKKTPQNAPPIRIPLSKKVLDILTIRRLFAPDKNGNVWYAAAAVGKDASEMKPMSDARAAWTAIEVLLDLHFTPHDLRRTFAGLGTAAAEDLFAVSLLMMHSSTTLAKAANIPDITLDYMDTDEAQDRMRKAAEAIAAHVDKLLAGAAATPEPTLPKVLEEALAATD